MLVPTWMGTSMGDGNQQKHLRVPRVLVLKLEFIPRGTHKH